MTQDRESWEAIVAAMLATPSQTQSDTRGTLKLLAGLLRNDQLPESGRAWLADRLDKIGNGADPTKTLIPPPRKKKGASPMDVMVAVERAMSKAGAGYGDKRAVYEQIAAEMRIDADTVQSRASKGRRQLREGMQRNVDAGADPGEVCKLTARVLKLPVDVVRNLFIRTPAF